MGRARVVTIRPARNDTELRLAAELVREYAAGLGFSLDFQDFESELKGFPGHYSPPSGELLLATKDGRGAGVVGLRRFEEGTCEMKRLFVRPEFRGLGLGRRLAAAIVADARQKGYRAMLLDTVPSMTTAIALYRSLGFVEVPAYRYNPVPGAVYFRAQLA
jgi:putative acetyltransferase